MSKVKSRLGVMGSLFKFLWKRKLWWLIPFVVILLLFGVLIIVASVTPVGPFIYALI